MRSLPLVLICTASVAACGAKESSADSLARLTVSVDDDGAQGPDQPKQLTVDCSSASQSAACGAAAKLSSKDLAPTPAGIACSQLYGGPQTAKIAGTLRGERVDARFSRINGCETARWGRVQALLGGVR